MRLLHQLGDRYAENFRQRDQHQKRRIRLAPLDRREVVRVHAGVEGERFLREVAFQPQLSHSCAEASEGGGVAFDSHLASGVFSHYPVIAPHRIM